MDNISNDIFIQGLADFYQDVQKVSQENEGLFPVEVDLTDNAFIYDKSFETLPPDEDEEPEPVTSNGNEGGGVTHDLLND